MSAKVAGESARLRTGQTETRLAFLEEPRRRGNVERRRTGFPRFTTRLGDGEAVIPDAVLFYRKRSAAMPEW
jgi:hypothetical protein